MCDVPTDHHVARQRIFPHQTTEAELRSELGSLRDVLAQREGELDDRKKELAAVKKELVAKVNSLSVR